MSFLRTVSTRRLLAGLAGLLIVVVGGSAIAVAAAGNGPVPKRRSLAAAVHRALQAKPVRGVYARIWFTNNLIASSNLQGSDPLLTGAPGRLWVGDGRIRLELQSDSGNDAQVVFNHGSFWVYDPAMNVIYRGKVPAGVFGKAASGHGSATSHSAATRSEIPSVAQIQKAINHLAQSVGLSGAKPTDVGGQAAYRVTVSPKTGGGLIGALKLAWDATHGVPLDFAVYAKGNSTPVLELQVSGISYSRQPASVFKIKPPSGTRIVNVAIPKASKHTTAHGKHHAKPVTGVNAVQKHLSFKLSAPGALAGRARHSVALVGKDGALLFYGKGLGGIVVLEHPGKAGLATPATSSGGDSPGLTLPTTTIHGVTAQQLPTPLGTVVQFSRGGVSYLVMGSVTAGTADAAARGL